MSDKSEISIDRVFELMDQWRHLPDYQLERRADIFFALFLPEVLKEHFKLDQEPVLIPEFPIKNREDNHSSKVDYLALQRSKSDKPNRAFLVELKTDMGSRRDVQDNRLLDAKERGLPKLVAGVVVLCGATQEKRKYAHLLKLLSDVDLIEYEEVSSLERHREYRDVLDYIKGKEPKPRFSACLEVVYVQPFESTVIDFEKFAKYIKCSGKVGQLFAKYLRAWMTPAGLKGPKDLSSC